VNQSILFLALVWSSCSLAQTPNFIKANSNVQSILNPNSQTSVIRPFDNRNKSAYGTPTLSEQYVPGEINMEDGKNYTVEKTNYDAYADQLLVMSNGQESIVSAQAVKGFKLKMPEGEMLFTRITEPNGAYGFYQKIIATTKLTIYKKQYKKLNQPTAQETFASGKTYSEFISAQKLFFAKGPDNLVEVKNKKSLVILFEEIKAPLENFLKKESINLKVDADLIKVANFIEAEK